MVNLAVHEDRIISSMHGTTLTIFYDHCIILHFKHPGLHLSNIMPRRIDLSNKTAEFCRTHWGDKVCFARPYIGSKFNGESSYTWSKKVRIISSVHGSTLTIFYVHFVVLHFTTSRATFQQNNVLSNSFVEQNSRILSNTLRWHSILHDLVWVLNLILWI